MLRVLGELGTMGADLGKASRKPRGDIIGLVAGPMISGFTSKTKSTSASTSERDKTQW